MRYKNLFGLLIRLAVSVTLALGLSTPGLMIAAGTAIVSVVTPSQTIGSGETFTVNIAVEPNNNIAGLQFNLTFDPSLVTASSVAQGNLLSQSGATTYFSPGVINNVAGNISGVAGAIITPGQTVSTAGIFATITLTAGTEGGTCPLTLSGVVVGDIEGNPLPLSVIDGTIDINQPPVLAPIGAKSVTEGQLLQFTISATDPNNNPLTYSANLTSLPPEASFNSGNQTFSWTPRYDQAGVYTVHFEVTDGGLTDTEDITITVIQLYEDWDVNGDSTANVLDMILVGQHWGETGLTGWIREDANEDGTVNVLDMIIIGQHWTG